MTTHPRVYFRIAAAAAVAMALVILVGVAAPAFAAPAPLTTLAQAKAPVSRSGAVIPLRSLEDLTSLNAAVELDVNGFIDGERARGDLNLQLVMNDRAESKTTVTGSLLGTIAGQAGGGLLGLFTPSSVDLYDVASGNFVVLGGFFPVCVKLTDRNTTATLDELSPQSLLSMLTSSDVARGKLIGREKLNGALVKHYELEGDAFLAAARRSSDPQLRSFGRALSSAEDADLYVDEKTGYPVAFRGGFSGAYEPLAFEGDLDVAIGLTGVNTNSTVKLPNSCNRPVTP